MDETTQKLIVQALKKLFYQCESEYPEELWDTDYPHIREAENLLIKLGVIPAKEVNHA